MANEPAELITPPEENDLVRRPASELWPGDSDGARASWMTGYLILKLQERCRSAHRRPPLKELIRTAVSVIVAAENVRALQKGRADVRR